MKKQKKQKQERNVHCIYCNKTFDIEELDKHSCPKTHGADGIKLLSEKEIEEIAIKMVNEGIWNDCHG